MRAYEILLQRVEKDLREGRLKPGTALPSERALATELGLSRGAVREGLQTLEAMGLVRRSTGSGREAGTIITANPSHPLTSAMRLHITSGAFRISDVVETRLMLESWAAEHAALSNAPMDDADRLLAEMDVPGTAPEQFLVLDAQFHVAIAAMSGNPLVGEIMASLRQAHESYVLMALPMVTDWPAMLQTLRREHHGIADAIKCHDPETARRAVIEHVRGYYQVTGLQDLQD